MGRRRYLTFGNICLGRFVLIAALLLALFSTASFAARSGTPPPAKALTQQARPAKADVTTLFALGQRAEKNTDYVMAAAWYRRAAEQGFADAQGALGDLYFNGHGVKQDFVEAVRWYRKSAEQGNPAGEGILGYMYAEGLGIAQDYVEAVKWYHKAASKGNSMAQAFLGKMYGEGLGVTQDFAEAYFWLNLASVVGHTNFVNFRDSVAQKLPPDALLAVQKRALDWRPG